MIELGDDAVVATRDGHRSFVALNFTNRVELVYVIADVHVPRERVGHERRKEGEKKGKKEHEKERRKEGEKERMKERQNEGKRERMKEGEKTREGEKE